MKSVIQSILIYTAIGLTIIFGLDLVQPLSIAYAHHYDAPGPPALYRKALVDSITFSNNPAEGEWGDAELIITGEAEHTDHTKTTFFLGESLNGKSLNLSYYAYYYEPDCTTADLISMEVTIIEADTDAALKDFGGILMAGGALVAGASWVSGGGLVIGGIVFVVGAISYGLGAMNGDDSYGKAMLTVPINGDAKATASGPSGRATVNVRGTTATTFPDTLCPASPAPLSFIPNNEKEIYVAFADSLRNSWQQIESIEAEPGSGITSSELVDIQVTEVSYVLGAAQVLAASTLRAAAGHEGVDIAISKFQEGQELFGGGNLEEAFEAYLQASSLGMESSNNTRIDDAMPLPFELIMIPSYFSTKTGESVVLGGTVLGAGNETSIFEIAGFPESISAETVPWANDPSYFHLQLELGDTPPGTYDGVIYVTSGERTDQSIVTLVVNERAILGERPESVWNPVIAEQPNFNQSMLIAGSDQNLTYSISNGTVTSMSANPEMASLLIDIDSQAQGYLILDLPNSIIEAEPDGNVSTSDDESFVILVDEQDTVYGARTTEDGRILTIPYNDTATQIEIRGSALTLNLSPAPPAPAIYSFEYEDRTFPLEYSMSGGSIVDVQIDKARSSLLAMVESRDGGKLTITLDRELIDAKEAEEALPFVVLIEGNQVEYEELESTQSMRQLSFEIPAGQNSIEVVGTSVIPEFPMAILTLVVATAAVLILISRNGLSFRRDRQL